MQSELQLLQPDWRHSQDNGAVQTAASRLANNTDPLLLDEVYCVSATKQSGTCVNVPCTVLCSFNMLSARSHWHHPYAVLHAVCCHPQAGFVMLLHLVCVCFRGDTGSHSSCTRVAAGQATSAVEHPYRWSDHQLQCTSSSTGICRQQQ